MNPNTTPHEPIGKPRWSQRALNSRSSRIVAWSAAGIAAAIILVLIATSILVRSASFHRHLIAAFEDKASASLGVRVKLQDFSLHLSTLGVDLYGITVDGAKPYPDPPVLQIEHAQASVRVVSILRGKWYLDDLRIDRPVVKVFVDSHGVSNIPTPTSKGGTSSNAELFDLGIRHALIDHGEVFYNNRPSEISFDLHEVSLRASFDSLMQRYTGRLAYSDGRIVYGALHPLPHSLDVEFDATRTAFRLSRATLDMDASQIVLSGTLDDYSHPAVQARYDANIDGAQLGHLLHNDSLPSGMIRAIGSLQYQQIANRSLLETLVLNGDLTSRKLALKISSTRGEMSDITAQYSLANGNAVVRSFRAGLLGGKITAAGSIKNLGGDSHGEINAAINGVSLAQLSQMSGRAASMPNVALAGVLSADATATWGKSFNNLVAHANVAVNGQIARNQNAVKQIAALYAETSSQQTTGPAAIPVEVALHATYNADDHQLALDKSYLRTQQTNLALDGAISRRSSLNLRLQSNDLGELAAIANLFQSSPGSSHYLLGLGGTAIFQGSVQGSTAAPHLTGQLKASNLRVNGTDWKGLRTNIDLNPSQIGLQNTDIESASHGRITFNASAGLAKWSIADNSPIQVELHASQVNIADLNRLAGKQLPLTGTLNANVKLRGTKVDPVGSGDVSLNNAVAYEERVQSAELTFSGDNDEVRGELSVQLPSGSLRGKASVRRKQRTYAALLTANGIRLDQLQGLKSRNIDATGIAELSAKGQGTFDNPQLDASLQIPKLIIQGEAATGLDLQMNVADHVANSTLAFSAVGAPVQAKATIDLTGDYLADASLDARRIPLQPLFAAYLPDHANDVSGETEVHATLHGPLKNKSLLDAHVTIPSLKLAYGSSFQLAAASPIHVDYKDGVIDVQRASLRGTDTDLEFQGSVPTSGNGAMSLLLHGNVGLQLAQLFDPDIRSSGQLKFNVDSHGAIAAGTLGGEIDVVDANYSSDNLPVALQHGNGVLKLTTDRVNIERFEATAGGGSVTAQGGVSFRPGIKFDLGVVAKGMRILYPQGMRESVDANLRVAGTAEDAVLGGAVNLSDLSFTPAFDLTGFVNELSGGVAAPSSRGFAQAVQLNVAVHSTNSVNLVSRTLSVGGSASLQVRGTAATPVILGRVNLNNGDIILNGNRFVLNGGTIQFVNPSETRPVVNLTLTTNIQQYKIDLRFNGPVEQMRTEYSSDPALPSADIINLLAFGQTTEANAANPTTPASQAAESLVASQVSSQVTSRLSKVAGISQLSINPVLAGNSNQGPPGANITIQQRVTGNLFVTFSTNVASTQSQIIQGQYQLSPRVALSATRDQNGGFAVDTLIKKTW